MLFRSRKTVEPPHGYYWLKGDGSYSISVDACRPKLAEVQNKLRGHQVLDDKFQFVVDIVTPRSGDIFRGAMEVRVYDICVGCLQDQRFLKLAKIIQKYNIICARAAASLVFSSHENIDGPFLQIDVDFGQIILQESGPFWVKIFPFL